MLDVYHIKCVQIKCTYKLSGVLNKIIGAYS